MQTKQDSLENPYVSPAVPCHTDSELRYDPAHLIIETTCEARRMLYRRIRLYGQVQGTIEWDARSVLEVIRVGKKAVRRTCPFWYTPRFEFVIETEERRFPATIDVRLSRVLPIFVRKFRLIIEGQVAYQEGDWTGRMPLGGRLAARTPKK